MESFLFKHIICNEKYFCNNNYEYSLQSKIIGEIVNETKGCYIFHLILKNELMSDVFLKIMKGESELDKEKDKEDRKDLYLLLNEKNELPIECVVFGSYNEKYQELKDFKNKEKNKQDELIQLLHRVQKESIDAKLANIK